MNAAAPTQAIYGRTADGDLAALVGDNAYLALPVGDGLRLWSGWRIDRPIAEWRRADFSGFGDAIADEATPEFFRFAEDDVELDQNLIAGMTVEAVPGAIAEGDRTDANVSGFDLPDQHLACHIANGDRCLARH